VKPVRAGALTNKGGRFILFPNAKFLLSNAK